MLDIADAGSVQSDITGSADKLQSAAAVSDPGTALVSFRNRNGCLDFNAAGSTAESAGIVVVIGAAGNITGLAGSRYRIEAAEKVKIDIAGKCFG